MTESRSNRFLRSTGVFLLAAGIGLLPNFPGFDALRDLYPEDLKDSIFPAGLLMGAAAVAARLLAMRRQLVRATRLFWLGWVVLVAGLIPLLVLDSLFVLRWEDGEDNLALIVGSVDAEDRTADCDCPPQLSNLDCIEKHLTTEPAKIDACWGEKRMRRIRTGFRLSYFVTLLGAGSIVGTRTPPSSVIKLKLFLSYRRADSSATVGRIYEHLTRRVRREDVFKDVDSIDPGQDFEQTIQQYIPHSDVMLVVIGPSWTQVRDAKEEPRLEDPKDWVRLEIEAALWQEVRIVPLLVGGAAMPSAKELPTSLQQLTKQLALPIRDDPDFKGDMDRLLATLEQLAKSKSLLGRLRRLLR